MRASFEQKLIAASGFLVLCSVGACIFGAANGANAAARTAQTEISAVNRINKGDQLTPALIHHATEAYPTGGGHEDVAAASAIGLRRRF